MEQFKGTIVNGALMLTDDGLPVELSDAPAVEPGYVAVGSWVQVAGAIKRVWKVEPKEGMPEEAATRLAAKLARDLPDDEAPDYTALFPAWTPIDAYAPGDRVRNAGSLFKCIKANGAAPLQAQSDEATDATQAPVVPGESPAYWQLLGPKS